ncbi:ABC-type transport system involved in cytochrome c biogenesis ATPase subunit [Neisseria sp. HSC-16F19]|nr:ABC transporter ATP-binding protein [Neisseria sp. HSC-16F19]MCP2041034.1 ABC-type transport system involved in cytochrome c biogenesis ATPase subunit [Neisseria sp. HSC-16F19]
MMIDIHNRCADFQSYRSARVKSLFNVESGADFTLQAGLPLTEQTWQIGVVVGPSGSGKTSIGKAIGSLYAPAWPRNAPIVDAITPDGGFDDVTAALSSVGLGSVPTWLRPFQVLSNGEQFRATLARLICEAPDMAVLDEFSSVVDRQIAQVGAAAFAKAWRRRQGKQVVLLSCHYDILDWVQPDWVFDTESGRFQWGWLRPRPRYELEIYPCKQADWALFEPHHYLKLPPMIAATHYMGLINGQPVAHIAFSTRPGLVEARACRLVVMPEWQGAGVGMRFLNACCEMWLQGQNRYGLPLRTLFHTSHPGLAAALRRDRRWTQVSAVLHGGNKVRSRNSIERWAAGHKAHKGKGAGYGGHFRAVQGFRYLGDESCGL